MSFEQDDPRLTDAGGSAFLNAYRTKTWRGGVMVACLSVLAAVGLRLALEPLAKFYYLPMVPAVMATALLAQRSSVGLAIVLAIAGSELTVQRTGVVDALANLVRNAVDAVVDRADGRVTVSGRALGADGYEIAVRDNGRGIPADQMDRIFHPMISTKTGGMGLGLSVTRSIVESHGSALSVSRPPGGGACVTFRLSRPTEPEIA